MLQKRVSIILCLVLFVALLSPMANANAEEKLITMTTLYKAYESGTSVDITNYVVTISSAEEMKYFSKYADKISSIRLLDDIELSPFTYDFDINTKKVGIYKDGNLVAVLGVDGKRYKDYDSPANEYTYEELGLSDYIWKGFYYSGTFDGNGKKITGMLSTRTESRNEARGLFTTFYGTVRDLTIDDALVLEWDTNAFFSGAFAGYSQGFTTKNCRSNAIVIGAAFAGGWVGQTTEGVVDNLTISGTVYANWKAGGYCGTLPYNGNEKHVFRFKNYQLTKGSLIYGMHAGGIGSEIGYLDVDTCHIDGEIYAKNRAGGLAGTASGCRFSNVINEADVVGEREAGGIAASIEGYSYVENCLNIGTVSGGSLAAGIAGQCKGVNLGNDCSYIKNIANMGTINCDYQITKDETKAAAGELFGYAETNSFSSCYYPAGKEMIGEKGDDVELENCQEFSGGKQLATLLNEWIANQGVDSLYREWICENDADMPSLGDYYKKIAEPTPTPVVTPTPTPTITPTPTPTSEKKSFVSKLYAKKYKSVEAKLSWTANGTVNGYYIYRGMKNQRKFSLIAQLNTTKGQQTYIDKKAKRGTKYIYKIVPFTLKNGQKVMGTGRQSSVVSTDNLVQPTIRIKFTRSKKIKYMQLQLKQYEGKYAEILMQRKTTKGQDIHKLNCLISKYKGKFKWTYVKGDKQLQCKVRTYTLKKGKKIYSKYSKRINVKLS